MPDRTPKPKGGLTLPEFSKMYRSVYSQSPLDDKGLNDLYSSDEYDMIGLQDQYANVLEQQNKGVDPYEEEMDKLTNPGSYEEISEMSDINKLGKLNYRFDPQSFTFKAYNSDGEHVERNFGQKLKDNKTPLIQGGLSLANAYLGNREMYRNDQDRMKHTQDMLGTEPIWDYNEMYGDNTNGGSQFQPIVKAEKGAKVRSMLNTAAPINIEGGEFIVMPDGTTELAKGPKHKNGGINTILPEGAIIYSNKLKPEGSKKTFAQLAKDNDTTSYIETLKNPYSNTIERTTAERMMQRKQQKLAELFQQQQTMNGDSSGEPVNDLKEFEDGGQIKYELGGEVELTKSEIEKLKKQGYKIEIL